MNLLFVVNCLSIGGAQTFLLRLVRALAPSHKIVIYVLIPERRDQNLEDSFLKGLNVKILNSKTHKISPTKSWIIGKIGNTLYRLGYRTFRKDVTTRMQSRELQSIIKSENIDCINSHLFASDWLVFQSIRNISIKWVVSMHGCYETHLHGGYNKNFRLDYVDPDFIEKAQKVYSRADAVVVASDKNREIEQYLPPDLLERTSRKKIYYGFQPNNFIPKLRIDQGIPEDSLVFGMVARGIEEKGWRFLLESFTQLLREGYDAYLILVCDWTEHIKELASQYQHEKIRFIGPSYNPLEWISIFDIAVLPTYFPGESLPNSVIEYLYASKPVIATNTGDISNMISYEDQKAGFLIPLTSSNRPVLEALNTAMKAYLIAPELITEHAEIAKLAFLKFDMDSCMESYLELYMS